MKKALFLLLIIIFIVAVFYFLRNSSNKMFQTLPSSSESVNPVVSETATAQKKLSIFVPYWTMKNFSLESQYDRYIYFGIAADKSGIDRQDAGFVNLSTFNTHVDSTHEKLLTIRMVNSDINSEVLRNGASQNAIIQESIEIAKDNNFDGIVLDFETASLSFDSVVNRISNFEKKFYDAVKKENLQFLLTVYGDTFFRSRPYDIKFLADNSDEILIMTYDFHKARGNPGPNFPLQGKEKYGYDLHQMIDDFLEHTTPEHITVILGLYGYDWTVDSKGVSRGTATPITYNEINQKFLLPCADDLISDCVITKDTISQETEIQYTDDEKEKHVIWFEDMDSVQKKNEFLTTKGITSTVFWAYSYF